MAQTHSTQAAATVAATPSTVYRFVSDPAAFAMWMGQGSSISGEKGAPVTIRFPNGETARGKVADLAPGKKIVFTYGYETPGRPPVESTRVTIQLQEGDNGTRVTLTHDNLPSDQEAAMHGMGWRHFLGMLASAASHVELDGPAQAAVDAYTRAWNERDIEKRGQLLEKCWEETATYRDPMAYVEGRDHLRDHIGASQMFAPDARLEASGSVEQSQGAVRFPWAVRQAGDKVMVSGSAFGQLSLKGRFTSVVSFWDAPRP